MDPTDFKQAWDVVIEALARTEPERRGEFEKAVYVQHIGLMGVTMHCQTTVVNSRLPEDVPSEDLIFQHKDGMMGLAYETHPLDNRSWFPRNLIALYGEQTAMARAWQMIRDADAALHRPLALAWYVDGIALAEMPPKLRKRAIAVKYLDGTHMHQIKQEK